MALHSSSETKLTVATIKDRLLEDALAGSKMVKGVVRTHNSLTAGTFCVLSGAKCSASSLRRSRWPE